MKAFGISMTAVPTKKTNANMLESPYSKTFIYTPQTKEVDVKEVLELISHLDKLLKFCQKQKYLTFSKSIRKKWPQLVPHLSYFKGNTDVWSSPEKCWLYVPLWTDGWNPHFIHTFVNALQQFESVPK